MAGDGELSVNIFLLFEEYGEFFFLVTSGEMNSPRLNFCFDF
jgi:hypothetical protein